MLADTMYSVCVEILPRVVSSQRTISIQSDRSDSTGDMMGSSAVDCSTSCHDLISGVATLSHPSTMSCHASYLFDSLERTHMLDRGEATNISFVGRGGAGPLRHHCNFSAAFLPCHYIPTYCIVFLPVTGGHFARG